ncbi:MAG TPA: ABC transporter permease [Nitrolancea sp.]|nr:ABC transporter permease [Nitrolancea sp.]
MISYVIRRLLQGVLVLFIVSLVTFFLIHAAPGGPALLSNPELSRDEVAQIKQNLGLSDPLPVQYVRWMSNVLQGNLGTSYSTLTPVSSLLRERLPNTLLLGGLALLLSVAVSIPLGIASALRRNSVLDRALTGFAFLGVSVPVFWLAIILIIIFSVELHVLPSGNMFTVGESFSLVDRIKHLVLPVVTLLVLNLATLTRYTRSAMIDVLGQDYIRTARAKGLESRTVIYRHALRNAMIPVITIIGVFLPNAVAGAAITETVFAWPGMGLLAVNAADTRDYPVVLGATLTVAVIVVLSNLLTDLLYGVLDPRIRLD